MNEAPEEVTVNIITYAIPGFVALILLEVVVSAYQKVEAYELKDTAASLSMGIGNVLVNILGKAFQFALLTLVYQYRLFDLEWSWLVALALFVGEDFCYYWFHRIGHESRVFWAAHVNHHSSERYNLSTALRQSWTTPFTTLCFWWPLALIGFRPEWIIVAQSMSLLYQFWIHTELINRLGPLEWIFNTPSHHRVHHASDLEYLDANYGGVLIVWDRLFGSFIAEEERPTYGLIHNIETFNPVRIAFHEWGSMFTDLTRTDSWRARFMYVFGPPGWSHDGSKQTVAQMRAEASGQAPADPSDSASPVLEPAAE